MVVLSWVKYLNIAFGSNKLHNINGFLNCSNKVELLLSTHKMNALHLRKIIKIMQEIFHFIYCEFLASHLITNICLNKSYFFYCTLSLLQLFFILKTWLLLKILCFIEFWLLDDVFSVILLHLLRKFFIWMLFINWVLT